MKAWIAFFFFVFLFLLYVGVVFLVIKYNWSLWWITLPILVTFEKPWSECECEKEIE